MTILLKMIKSSIFKIKKIVRIIRLNFIYSVDGYPFREREYGE